MLILWLGVLSDDERALVDQLFKETNVKLYHISLRHLRTPSDAEDAVSQSFLKIIDHIQKIVSLPCPQRQAYCVIIVKNTCMDILRKRKQQAHMELVEDLAEAEETGDAAFWEAADKEALQQAMDRLSAADRLLIQWRFGSRHRDGAGCPAGRG